MRNKRAVVYDARMTKVLLDCCRPSPRSPLSTGASSCSRRTSRDPRSVSRPPPPSSPRPHRPLTRANGKDIEVERDSTVTMFVDWWREGVVYDFFFCSFECGMGFDDLLLKWLSWLLTRYTWIRSIAIFEELPIEKNNKFFFKIIKILV